MLGLVFEEIAQARFALLGFSGLFHKMTVLVFQPFDPLVSGSDRTGSAYPAVLIFHSAAFISNIRTIRAGGCLKGVAFN